MKIKIKKALQPVVAPRVAGIKLMSQYQMSDYVYKDFVLEAPSNDITLAKVIDLTRVGAEVEAYEIWFEIPNANINDPIPDGVSFGTYLEGDDPPVEQHRTWADTTEYALGISNSLRYWQAFNDGIFNFEDVELIQEAGFEVLDYSGVAKKINTAEYSDVNDPEYADSESIELIDTGWRYSYFDYIAAWLTMKEKYEAKGADDNTRWMASNDREREILVRWNQVSLIRAQDIVDPSWTEARQIKEIGRKYRENEFNVLIALQQRFTDWYLYLNTMLTPSGMTKFNGDWNWEFEKEYTRRYIRQFAASETNWLVTFTNVTLDTYTESDFYGVTVTKQKIINALDRVLTEKEYFI